MSRPPLHVTVEVPATTSNLGPGFDAVGMALSLTSTFEVSTDVTETRVEIAGYGADTLPRDETHLVLATARDAMRRRGLAMPPVKLVQHNRVPLGSGLGSSSTAIVGGLMLAQALSGLPLDRAALLDEACAVEGHPDNAAPCVLGGLVTAVWDGARCAALPLPVASELGVVVCTPDLSLSTAEMRAALPRDVPFADAVFNGTRACLLVGALATGRLDLLATAVQDRLHVRHRARFVPGYAAVVDAAEAAGALVATLSGAGPTVVALTRTSEGVDDKVGKAMADAFHEAGLAATARVAPPRTMGAQLSVN